MKTGKPFIPREVIKTLRQAIIGILMEETLSSREISARVHIAEKEVLDHLAHISKASLPNGRRLRMEPPLCMKCGFSFRKRERLTRPGRCPVCRNSQISEPLYSIS